jgi:hypothetical protein
MVRVTYKSALDYSISSPLQERADEAGIFRIVRAGGQQHSDAPHLLRLLRLRHQLFFRPMALS